MGNIISLSIGAIIVVAFILNKRIGVFLLLSSILVAPYIEFGGMRFRIELAVEPILFILLLTRKSIVIPQISLAYIAWFIWAQVMTFLSFYINQTKIEWIEMYSVFRVFFLMVIVYNSILKIKDFFKLINLFIWISIPLSLFSIGQSLLDKSSLELAMQYYQSSSRNVIQSTIEGMTNGGGLFVFRGVSVFENVAPAATYLLLVIFVDIYILFHKEEKEFRISNAIIAISLIAAFIAGINTMSSTFYMGLVLIFGYFFYKIRKKIISILKILCISMIMIVFIAFIYSILYPDLYQRIIRNANYIAKANLSGRKLAQRYITKDRIGGDIVGEIKTNIICGYGYSSKKELIVNDSLFLYLLYQGGIVGIMLFIYVVKKLITKRKKYYKKQIHEIILIWFIVLLLTGVSTSGFFNIRISDWWWAIACIAIHLQTKKLDLDKNEKMYKLEGLGS